MPDSPGLPGTIHRCPGMALNCGLADLQARRLTHQHSGVVAGSHTESIFQPEWSPDGTLYFVSDRSGWWNLYRLRADGEIESVTELNSELGVPQWIFGMSNYAFESADKIICTYYERGMSKLASIDTRTRKLQTIDTNYTDITFLRAAPGQAVFRAGSPSEPPSIVRLDLNTGKPSRSCAGRTIWRLMPDTFQVPAPLNSPPQMD